jgi:hypothetical protein
MTYLEIEQRLHQAHLRCCGGFYPVPADDLADWVATAIIVGSARNIPTHGFWPSFAANRPLDTNPLEKWTTEVLSVIAADLKADVIFPFEGPPFIPILSWAERAEPVYPSPFGAFIHPILGLWHSYRGVLLFKEKIDLPATNDTPSPCETCQDRPCLSTCPVDAIKTGDFNVEACVGFLASKKGDACLQGGCLARRACPIGQEHIYEPAQANFHLNAFLKTFGPK